VFELLGTGLHWSGGLNNTAAVPGKASNDERVCRLESERLSSISSHLLTFSLSPLLLAVALPGAEVTAPMFLGSQSCASSSCHGGADEMHNQFVIWSKKDFHTRAPATLSMNRSARIAETLKISDATSDARCTVCHNPFQTVPAERKGPLVGKLEGVSCESCHNAAEGWLLTHTRTDLTHEQKVAAGLRDLRNLYVRANTCVACHQNLEPELRTSGHPELTFEMDGQCVTMPRHWAETNRLGSAQAWWVGQAVALREGSAGQITATNSRDEIAQRAAALAWLLGISAEQKSADKLARQTAQEDWSADDVKARLTKIAASHGSFNESTPRDELAQRAERLTLGVERLLVALRLNRDAVLSPSLDGLFKDVQSRPDFEPKKFASDLKMFEDAWRSRE
jgi:hypothetical protein